MSSELTAAISLALESPRLVRRLEILCRAMASESDALFAALFVLDESGRRIRIRGVCASPPFERTAPRIEVARSDSPILWEAITSGRGAVAPAGAGKGPRALEEQVACSTLMALPVAVGPVSVGAMLLGRATGAAGGNGFNEGEMVLATEVAAIAGACIAEASGPGTAAASGEIAEELKALQADFVASVTHELRTPLTSLLGLAKAAVEEHPCDETERLLAQAKRLGQLIEDMLASQRLEQKRSRLPLETIDLLEVAREVAGQWAETAPASIIPADIPITAKAHRGAVRTILRHLFANSARHAPAAEVSIRTEASDDTTCLLIFEDDGPGIPEDQREKVFERFYRIGSHSSRFTAGTGIGLFLVRRLAEEMGGSAAITEGSNGGAAVEIRLDRAPESGSAQDPESGGTQDPKTGPAA